MRAYVQETARRWEEFQSSHQAVAAEIRGLVLGVCSAMTAGERKKQIEAMVASGQFNMLRDILIKYDSALGIREHADREFALWIRTICFCQLMRQNQH